MQHTRQLRRRTRRKPITHLEILRVTMRRLLLLGRRHLRSRLRWRRRRNRRDPKLRVLALDVVDQQRRHEDQGRRQEHDGKEVPAQRPDVRVDAREQRGGARGRVRGPREMHDDQGDGSGQARRDPLQPRRVVVVQVELEDGGDDGAN